MQQRLTKACDDTERGGRVPPRRQRTGAPSVAGQLCRVSDLIYWRTRERVHQRKTQACPRTSANTFDSRADTTDVIADAQTTGTLRSSLTRQR
jgi:hypothetical protein